MMRRLLVAAVLAAAFVMAGPDGATAQETGGGLIEAGTMAPDFELTGATRHGVLRDKFRGSLRDDNMVGSRAVIVIGPDGRVAKVVERFNQVDPAAYVELATVIDEVTPEPEEGS